eukprot:gene12630-15428_t
MGYVVVPMTDCHFLIEDASGERRVTSKAGEVYRRDAGVEHNVVNGGDQPMMKARKRRMQGPDFDLDFKPAHGEAVTVADGVQRITVNNPGPFTFHGTNSYIVGGRSGAVIDPGPDDAAHCQALMTALAPIALTTMTLWVALYGWAVLRNVVSETLPTFMWKVFKIGLVLTFALQSGFYISNVADTANALATGVATTFLTANASPQAI